MLTTLTRILPHIEESASDIMNGEFHDVTDCNERDCILCSLRGAVRDDRGTFEVAERLISKYPTSKQMQDSIPKYLIEQLRSDLSMSKR